MLDKFTKTNSVTDRQNISFGSKGEVVLKPVTYLKEVFPHITDKQIEQLEEVFHIHCVPEETNKSVIINEADGVRCVLDTGRSWLNISTNKKIPIDGNNQLTYAHINFCFQKDKPPVIGKNFAILNMNNLKSYELSSIGDSNLSVRIDSGFLPTFTIDMNNSTGIDSLVNFYPRRVERNVGVNFTQCYNQSKTCLENIIKENFKKEF